MKLCLRLFIEGLNREENHPNENRKKTRKLLDCKMIRRNSRQRNYQEVKTKEKQKVTTPKMKYVARDTEKNKSNNKTRGGGLQL